MEEGQYSGARGGAGGGWSTQAAPADMIPNRNMIQRDEPPRTVAVIKGLEEVVMRLVNVNGRMSQLGQRVVGLDGPRGASTKEAAQTRGKESMPAMDTIRALVSLAAGSLDDIESELVNLERL